MHQFYMRHAGRFHDFFEVDPYTDKISFARMRKLGVVRLF